MIILVAEDEALVALVLELALGLGLAGHEVLGPAGGVDQALRLVGERRPDLGLIDINLRDGDDGVGLARRLKERWAVPCLFLSGQVIQARAASDIALGLIGKPYDPDEVVEAVAAVGELLAGRQPGRVPPRLELFRAQGYAAGWTRWDAGTRGPMPSGAAVRPR
jgi:DNA-binding response OmpR family regulator